MTSRSESPNLRVRFSKGRSRKLQNWQLAPKIDEQAEVITKLSEGYNVCLNSVAGSGKTTCALHIAKELDQKQILLLTYNATLKLDTRSKADKLGLNNLEVHSYHSFAYTYWAKECRTDNGIARLLSGKLPKRQELDLPNVDILIIDEAQDMKPLFYEMCKRLIIDRCPGMQCCIIGDLRQTIYQFMDADPKYLKNPEEWFTSPPTLLSPLLKKAGAENPTSGGDEAQIYGRAFSKGAAEGQILGPPFSQKGGWVRLNLSTSHRIPGPIVNFINKMMLHEDVIIAAKPEGAPPRFLFTNPFNTDAILDEIKYYINSGYTYSDIMILSYSAQVSVTKKHQPVTLLENRIKHRHPEIMVVSSKTTRGGSATETYSQLRGSKKMLFSTFHSSKGLERKVVIIFGFDQSYYYYDRDNNNHDIAPNLLYVAATRCSERLTCIISPTQPMLPFLDRNFSNLVEMVGNESPFEPPFEPPFEKSGRGKSSPPFGKSGRGKSSPPSPSKPKETAKRAIQKNVTGLTTELLYDLKFTQKFSDVLYPNPPTEPPLSQKGDECGFFQKVQDADESIPPQPSIWDGEYVADITGTAANLALEYYCTGKLDRIFLIKEYEKLIFPGYSQSSLKLNGKTNEEIANNLELLVFAATISTCMGDFIHRCYQITNWSWLDYNFKTMILNAKNYIQAPFSQKGGDIIRCEVPIYCQTSTYPFERGFRNLLEKAGTENPTSEGEEIQILGPPFSQKGGFYQLLCDRLKNMEIYGRVDLVNDTQKIVYEIKCVEDLEMEHFLQLLLYKIVDACAPTPQFTDYKWVLLNIRTLESWTLASSCP